MHDEADAEITYLDTASEPGRVEQVLREIESDPTGIFWG